MMILKNRNVSGLVLAILMVFFFCDFAAAQQNPRRSSGSQVEEERESRKESKRDTSKTDGPRFVDKLTFGGNVSAFFGQATLVEIAPLVGYRIKEDLIVGAGPTYIYRNFTRAINQLGYTEGFVHDRNSIYGGRVFGHYNVFSNFFVRSEFEALSISHFRFITNDYDRRLVTSLLGGGGYRQMIGPRSSVNFMILYDFNYNKYSYNLSPWVIRVGFLL